MAGRHLEVDPIDAARVALAVAQVVMLWRTWPLWQDRGAPPTLPVLDGLPALSMGWLLVASLVLVVTRPRWGIPVHVLALVAALALDQHRLQPQFVSVALLLVGTGPWRRSPTVAWAHLASLWLWAGLAKAASPGFGRIAEDVAGQIGLPGLQPALVWLIPAGEITLGVLACSRRTRRWAGWGGVGLHLVIPFAIGLPVASSISCWNLALAVASLVFLALSPPERPERDPRAAGFQTVLVVLLFAYPAGAYLGLVDPYLAHHVYSGDVPAAEVCTPDQGCSNLGLLVSGVAVSAPIPPSPRVYRAWFQRTCLPGQTLRIEGLRLRGPLARLDAAGSWVVACRRQA